MQKQIKVIDEKAGVLRISTTDERWYTRPGTNNKTGLPDYEYSPSVTWIAGFYPKSLQFYQWIAKHGWDESQAIKESAGRRGTIVHKATEILEETGELPISTLFSNPDDGSEMEMGSDELDGVLSFKRWHDATKPKLIANEMTVFGEGYAGTLDRIYLIDGRIWIVDLKTSQHIWEEHKLQLSAYSHADIDIKKLGISKEAWADRGLAVLQLGYRMNRAGYKFNEVEDKYNLFKMAMAIWANENPDAKPKQREYPLTIRINEKEKSNARHEQAVEVS